MAGAKDTAAKCVLQCWQDGIDNQTRSRNVVSWGASAYPFWQHTPLRTRMLAPHANYRSLHVPLPFSPGQAPELAQHAAAPQLRPPSNTVS